VISINVLKLDCNLSSLLLQIFKDFEQLGVHPWCCKNHPKPLRLVPFFPFSFRIEFFPKFESNQGLSPGPEGQKIRRKQPKS